MPVFDVQSDVQAVKTERIVTINCGTSTSCVTGEVSLAIIINGRNYFLPIEDAPEVLIMLADEVHRITKENK